MVEGSGCFLSKGLLVLFHVASGKGVYLKLQCTHTSRHFSYALVLQIPCENVFRHAKPTLKPLAERIGA